MLRIWRIRVAVDEDAGDDLTASLTRPDGFSDRLQPLAHLLRGGRARQRQRPWKRLDAALQCWAEIDDQAPDRPCVVESSPKTKTREPGVVT